MLGSAAQASPQTLAQSLAAALGGIQQNCPATPAVPMESAYVRADGIPVSVAARLDALTPRPISGLWRGGQDGGLIGDATTEPAQLSLVGLLGGQVLLVLQAQGAALPVAQLLATQSPQVRPPAPTTLSADTLLPLETQAGPPSLDNPANSDVVFLGADGQSVQNLGLVRGGTFTVMVSHAGSATQTGRISVGETGGGRLKTPSLPSPAPLAGTWSLILYAAPGSTLLIV